MHSVALGEISTPITKGATPTTYGFEWQASGVPFLRSECVSEKGLDMRQSMFISSAAHASLQRSQVVEGDILLTITGNIGRVVQLEGIEEANINQHIARVRVIDERLHPRYVYHYLSQRVVRRYYESITTGQAYPQISLAQVQSTSIPLISKIEQKEIVAALDDADKLINSLERLISKKQAVKQGMMQELLTGRRRLQGFSKSWQATTFGDLVRIQRGSVLTRAQAGSGRIPVVAGGKTPAGYTDKANRVGRTITISASGASAGYVALYNEPIFASDCSTISSSRHYDLDFIYYSLLLRQDDIYRAQTGGAQPHIHAHDVYPMEIRVPTDMQEQIAIAQVLVDADKEIMALERRLESTRSIKQGMMQELLTGRTRLVSEGVR